LRVLCLIRDSAYSELYCHILTRFVFILKRTERALEEIINDRASTDDISREKQHHANKVENDVKEMEAKLTRADKSVGKFN
jgi:hypothetical protein